MSYVKATYKSRNAMDVSEYHTAKYGAPGQERQKKKKATPEQIEKQNRYNRERKVKWMIWDHFDVNDWLVTWTYRKDERPKDMVAAKKDFKRAIEKVKKEYKKRGYELKWIRNIEVGTRNSWHVHLIINSFDGSAPIIKGAWDHGGTDFKLLYADGEFRELASYISKTSKTESGLRETSLSHSRNLPIKEREKKVYLHWKTWKKVRIPKGWHLEKDTLHEGVNPVTGYAYRVYTLLKDRRC